MAEIKSISDVFTRLVVRINLSNGQFGTGFFFANDRIITCLHVIGSKKPEEIHVIKFDNTPLAVKEILLPKDRNSDLAILILHNVTETHLRDFIGFNQSIDPFDRLFSFGFSELDNHGAPVTFETEGKTGGAYSMIKFKAGLVRRGMSGSPILNLRTKKICGIMKYSENTNMPLGGGAIPVTTLIEQFPELRYRIHRGRKRQMLELTLVEKFTDNKDFIHMDAVSSEAQHSAMWRWNQRMYNHRYPQAFASFDMVGHELGYTWWKQYRKQDWVIRDWLHNQVGSYCLCPITKDAFSKAEKGLLIESDLTKDDIMQENTFTAHEYWYMASFIKAKAKQGVSKEFNQYALNLMIAHSISRTLWDSDFATSSGGEIVVIGFVEAPTIRKFAHNNRFHKAIPSTDDANLEKIYIGHWNRDQLFVKLEEAMAVLSTLKIPQFKKSQSPFLQPPDF